MRPAAILPIVPILSIALCACGPSFDPPELLNRTRLLAVAAEPPELGAGEKTTLRALVYPPKAAVTLEWAYCTQATTTTAVAPTASDCIENETAPFLTPIGDGESIEFTMPAFPPTQFGLPDSSFGVYLPIRVRLKEKGVLVETGIYRLRYTLPIPGVMLPKNQNPKLLGLYQVPDTAPSTGPTTQPLDETTPYPWDGKTPLKLRAALTDGSIETYQTVSGDLKNPTLKPANETIDFQWYGDTGKWSPPTTGPERPNTELALDPKKPAPATDRPIHIYIIARDERGGVAWLHRELKYQP